MYNLENTIQRNLLPKERKYLTLGSYEGKDVQWLEIIKTDKRWYLVSQFLYECDLMDDTTFWKGDGGGVIARRIEPWCDDVFAKEFVPSIKEFSDSTGCEAFRVHAISHLEIDRILKPEEKIACPVGSTEPHFYYLDSFHGESDTCVLVTEKGETIREKKPRFGEMIYVRVALELLAPKSPYRERTAVLTKPEDWAHGWYRYWPNTLSHYVEQPGLNPPLHLRPFANKK